MMRYNLRMMNGLKRMKWMVNIEKLSMNVIYGAVGLK